MFVLEKPVSDLVSAESEVFCYIADDGVQLTDPKRQVNRNCCMTFPHLGGCQTIMATTVSRCFVSEHRKRFRKFPSRDVPRKFQSVINSSRMKMRSLTTSPFQFTHNLTNSNCIRKQVSPDIGRAYQKRPMLIVKTSSVDPRTHRARYACVSRLPPRGGLSPKDTTFRHRRRLESSSSSPPL